METNSNINLGDDPSILQGKTKKFVPVVIAVLGIFLFGLTFYGFGLFDKKEQKAQSETPQIKVEQSKEKELPEKKIDFEQNGKIDFQTDNSTENYKAISGKEPNDKFQTNENLSPNDFEEIKRADLDAKPRSRKDRVNRKAQAQIELANRQNKRLMRNDNYLYKETQAEAEEARREQADRLANERQQNLILDQLEKANAKQNQNYDLKSELGDAKLNIKKSKTDIISTSITHTPPMGVGRLGLIAPVIGKNTTAQFWSKQTGFYNLNAKISNQSYAENRGILAVVHGEADGISVTNGQELKIRLLEPLRILEKEENIILAIGTLIPCTAKIGSDRILLNVEGIFHENKLHPINISVYDIDGKEGLNVPALLNSQSSNRLINNLSSPISGGQYFMPTGSISQQVGSSIAMNLAQNAIQTGSQYLRKKARIQKVEIRSNYKIILFNSKSNRNESTNNEEAFLED